MALVKKTSSVSKWVYIGIAAAAAIGLGYLLYITIFTGTTILPGGTTTATHPPVVKTFGESILNDPRYLNLVPYGQSPDTNFPVDRSNNPFQ